MMNHLDRMWDELCLLTLVDGSRWKFHSILTHLFHFKLTQVFHSILTHPFQSKLTHP
jgi:hypothetical protein